MGIYDVPAADLISNMSEELKKTIEKPAWADYVKTSVGRERAPDNRDWLYVRMASVLYRIYRDGPRGVGSLRSYYGGRKRKGVRKTHHVKASGKVLRFCMQSLEKEGLLEKAKKGRKISPKGQSLLEKSSKSVKAKMPKKPVAATEPEAKPEAKLPVKAEAKPPAKAVEKLPAKPEAIAKLPQQRPAVEGEKLPAKPEAGEAKKEKPEAAAKEVAEAKPAAAGKAAAAERKGEGRPAERPHTGAEKKPEAKPEPEAEAGHKPKKGAPEKEAGKKEAKQ
jgi:small subunit ribosomal protein S19e